jgi:anti-sigma regulatory factor (Ser/Thr protein kinase)
LQAATVPDHEATHLLPPDAASIVLARRAVEALPLGPARTGEVKLIVSELVTNSIEHGELGAHDRIEVRALVDRRGALHMEVRDPGPGPGGGGGGGGGGRSVRFVVLL